MYNFEKCYTQTDPNELSGCYQVLADDYIDIPMSKILKEAYTMSQKFPHNEFSDVVEEIFDELSLAISTAVSSLGNLG
jgi:thermostable 8-oxoguanine DNA glycosylase